MHALHATPLYWPSLGGGEQVTQALSERMAREGHEVTILTTDAAPAVRVAGLGVRDAFLRAGQ